MATRNYSNAETSTGAPSTRQVQAKVKPFASAAASDSWWESPDAGLQPFADRLNTAQRVRKVQATARALGEEMATMLENPDPFKTEAQNAKDMQAALDKRNKSLDNELKLAKQAAKAEREMFQKEIAALIPENESGRAAEIRSYFRGLKESERHSQLNIAIQNGDSETVAALTNAPSYLSGLDDNHKATARQRYAEQHAPESTQALAAVEKAETLAKQAWADATDYGVESLPDVLLTASKQETERSEKLAAVGKWGGDDDG